MDIQAIIQLATALGQFVVPSVENVIGALKGAGALTEAQVDDDLRALIAEALAAKAEADRAAAGLDPQ